MGSLKVDRVRESAPVLLNVVKDSSWCYTLGVVSVVAIIPVITFQVYEIWKCRKDGWHKISLHATGLVALLGNGSWMISDIFFHDHYRSYSKWIFGISWIFVGLFAYFSVKQAKKPQTDTPDRMMMVSKETGSLIFVHSNLAPLHRKSMSHRNHVMMVRPRQSRR